MGAEAGMYLGPTGGGQTLHDLTLLDPAAAGPRMRAFRKRARGAMPTIRAGTRERIRSKPYCLTPRTFCTTRRGGTAG